MSFLYPSMLWGLLALAIPIAVHLFNFRKHKLIFFSNTALLRTIQQENAKIKKLKYFVAFCLRCLFVIALVLAFAVPYKPNTNLNTDSSDNLVGIYIDNSMSMKTQSERASLLEDSREAARKLVARFNPTNRYVLMTNSFELQNEYPMNREEMLGHIDAMSIDGSPVNLNVVINRFAMLKQRFGFKTSSMFLYSDFQKNMFELSGVDADSSMQVVIAPLESAFRTNLYVDSVWLMSPILRPGLENSIMVRVANQSEEDVKGLPISFEIDDISVAFATADIDRNSKTDLTMQFLISEAGNKKGRVSLSDSPITFDDSFVFSLQVRPSLSIGEISLQDEVSPIKLLFDDDNQFQYSLLNPNRLDLTSFSDNQLLVLDASAQLNETAQQAVLDFVSDGGSLAIFPSMGPASNAIVYQKLGVILSPEIDTNRTSVDYIAEQHEFFAEMFVTLPQNADLPQVHKHFRMKMQESSSAVPLIALQNGDPLLYAVSYGKGQAYVFATEFLDSWSNFADNALFVPLLIKMAMTGGRVGDISYTIGRDKLLAFDDLNTAGDQLIKLRDETQSFEMIPAMEIRNNKAYLHFYDDLPSAGFYELVQNDSVKSLLAWNNDRIESQMDFVDKSGIKKAFENAALNVVAVMDATDLDSADVVRAMIRQSGGWKICIMLALLCLLGEILVLRFWKP
jgi:N-terminal double-transmembrane domain